MPVTFSFVEEASPDQIRTLLHKIGELPEVETFGEFESAHVPDGAERGFVIFERSGDGPDEDNRARTEIARALQRTHLVLDISIRAEP